MSDDNPKPREGITWRHWTVFGGIVREFARVETLISLACGWLADMHMPAAMIMTAGLPYAAKRDALLSLLRGLPMITAARRERLIWYLGEIHKHNQLRNWIAHAVWGPGSRPGAVRPGYVIVRGGIGKNVGVAEGDPEYTLDDLIVALKDLTKHTGDLVSYLTEEGMFDHIERKMSESNWSTSSSDGKPSAK